MVDNVSEVLSIAASEIEPAPAFGNDLRAEFIAGVAKVGDRFVSPAGRGPRALGRRARRADRLKFRLHIAFPS